MALSPDAPVPGADDGISTADFLGSQAAPQAAAPVPAPADDGISSDEFIGQMDTSAPPRSAIPPHPGPGKTLPASDVAGNLAADWNSVKAGLNAAGRAIAGAGANAVLDLGRLRTLANPYVPASNAEANARGSNAAPPALEQFAKSQEDAVKDIRSRHPVAGTIGAIGGNVAYALGLGAASPELDIEGLPMFWQESGSALAQKVGAAVPRGINSMLRATPKAAVFSAQNGAETAQNVYDQTHDATAATLAGTIDGVMTELIGSSAIGMTGAWWSRMLKGALFQSAGGEAQRRAINAVLPQGARSPFDWTHLMMNGALGAGFSLAFGRLADNADAVKLLYDQNDVRAAKGDKNAQLIATTASHLNAVQGTQSLEALVSATNGVRLYNKVQATPHAKLLQQPRYRAIHEASDGLGFSEDQRIAMAKDAFAREEMMNAAWRQMFKLKGITEKQARAEIAASNLPIALDRLTRELPPKERADVLEYVQSKALNDPESALAILNESLANKKLVPARQTELDQMHAHAQSFEASLANLDADARARVHQWLRAAQPSIADQQAVAQEIQTTGKVPAHISQFVDMDRAADDNLEAHGLPSGKVAVSAPARAALDAYVQELPPKEQANAANLATVAERLPPDLQLQLANWAPGHSLLEVDSAYREAAATGQLPAEVAFHGDEIQGQTEPAQVEAKQGRAGLQGGRAAQAQQGAENPAPVGGQEPGGPEGPVGTAHSEGAAGTPNAGGNAAAEGVAPLGKRAAEVTQALAAAGVPDDATVVTPKGSVRIAPDATPAEGDAAIRAAAEGAAASNTERGEPTPAQIEAGNYAKPSVVLPSADGDIEVRIENPDGSVRRGEWGSRPLKGVDYGYIPGTRSADGDPIDALVLPGASDGKRPVAFVRQRDIKTGDFDELKVVLGARNRQEALQAYWRQYPRDLHLKLTPDGADDVIMMTRAKASKFLRSGAVDVPPHPVSGLPMLRLRQYVPVKLDTGNASWNEVTEALDDLGKKHDLSRLNRDEDKLEVDGEVPRSAVPDLTRAMEKVHAQVEQLDRAPNARVAGARRPAQARTGTGRGSLPERVRAANAQPRRRAPPPAGLREVTSSAPVFAEGHGQHPVSVVGVHYSGVEGLTELDPAEAGTGSAGAERRRLGTGNFGRSGDPMARMVHFYVRSGPKLPGKEAVVAGTHPYESVLNNLYDVRSDPDGIIAKAEADGWDQNYDRVIEAIHDAGYDGFVSPENWAGTDARLASVVGVNGKIPTSEALADELAPKIAAKRHGRFEGPAKRLRDKFREAAKTTKEESEKALRARPLLRLAKRERPTIHMEMTASEKRPSLYFPTKGMSFAERLAISDLVRGDIGPANKRLAKLFPGIKVEKQVGGYGDDTSPSLRITPPKDMSPEDVHRLAEDLATAYTQDSVMLLDDREAPNGTALEIHFDDPKAAADPDKVRALWDKLRSALGDKVTGFTQTEDGIVILNGDVKFEDSKPWRDVVVDALHKTGPEVYDVVGKPAHVEFVGNRYDGTELQREQRAVSSGRELDILAVANAHRGVLSHAIGDTIRARGASATTARRTATGNRRENGGPGVPQALFGSPREGDAGVGQGAVGEIDAGGGREAGPSASAVQRSAGRYRSEIQALKEARPLPAGPSKLPEDLRYAVRTPSFEAWAGPHTISGKHALLDPETKEPQVFYHETGAPNVMPILARGFDTGRPLARIGDIRVPTGVFLKPSSKTIGVGFRGEAKSQLPLFVRARNVLHVPDKDAVVTAIGDPALTKEVRQMTARGRGLQRLRDNSVANAVDAGASIEAALTIGDHVGARAEDAFDADSLKLQERMRDTLKAKGYDVLAIDHDIGPDGQDTPAYIVLDPGDIKSTDNIGGFTAHPSPLLRRGGAKVKVDSEHVANVHQHAQHVLSNFAVKPDLAVHASRKDAPEDVRDALDATVGDGETPPAMYLGGKLHVFADQNATAAETESSILHEMVHYGLRRVFGDDMNRLLDDIWKTPKPSKAFKETLSDYRRAYHGRPELRRNIAEEYVARIAETGEDRPVWQRVVTWIRARMRSMGLVHQWTDEDIRGLVGSLYRDLRDSRTSVAGIDPAQTTIDYESGASRTPYRGGVLHEDAFDHQRFTSDGVDAALESGVYDGERALDATPKRLTPEGVRSLAGLAGEQHALLTLPPESADAVRASGESYRIDDHRIVLNPAPTEAPMFSMRRQEPMDDDMREIATRVIAQPTSPRSPWNWMQSRLHNFRARLLLNDVKRFMLDQGAYLDLSESRLNGGLLRDAAVSAYKMYHLARNYRQIAAGVLKIGVPEYKGGSFVAVPGHKGLMEIWKPLFQTADGSSHYESFGLYASAIRAKQLLHEFNKDGTPKEKLWTEADADKVIATMEAKHPEFKKVLADQQEFLKQLYDFAVDRGVMSRAQADAFTRNAYVPFFRVLQPPDAPAESVSTDAQRSRTDLVKSHRIKGSTLAIHDPLDAFVHNVIHTLDHIYTNEARRRIMALGTQMGAVKRMPLGWQPVKVSVDDTLNALRKEGIEVDRSLLDPEDLAQMVTVFHPVAPFSKDIQSTADHGKLLWWRVDDPRLLQTIQSLHDYNPLMKSWIVRAASLPAKWVRYGVTASPKFMARIMLKDAMQTFAQTGTDFHGLGVNMFHGAAKNALDIWNNARFIDQLRLNGFNGNEYYKIDQIKDYMDSLHGHNAGVLNSVRRMAHAYRRAGWVSEQLSRVRIAHHVIDNGGSWAEAAWQGQNTLNWQVHGASHLMQAFIRMVPFMNAHMRGIVRLYDGAVGRDVTVNRKRAIAGFVARSMVLGGLTMLLTAHNANNEDYERLPQSVKDAYWNFYVGGRHYMLPKPFEWGMLAASLPEHLYLWATRHEDGHQVAQAVNDMAFNEAMPVPVPPILTLAEAHYDFDIRNNRPILTTSQSESQLPQTRVNSNTTLAARKAGELTKTSPVLIDYVARNMFGSTGIFALQVASALMRTTGDFPATPSPGGASLTQDMLEGIQPFGGGRTNTETGDQYVSDFYDAQAKADDVVGSVHAYMTRGERGKAELLAEGNPLAFRGQHQLNQIAVRLKELRGYQRRIEASRTLTYDQKRESLQKINDAQRALMGKYEPFFRAVIDDDKTVERKP